MPTRDPHACGPAVQAGRRLRSAASSLRKIGTALAALRLLPDERRGFEVGPAVPVVPVEPPPLQPGPPDVH